MLVIGVHCHDIPNIRNVCMPQNECLPNDWTFESTTRNISSFFSGLNIGLMIIWLRGPDITNTPTFGSNVFIGIARRPPAVDERWEIVDGDFLWILIVARTECEWKFEPQHVPLLHTVWMRPLISMSHAHSPGHDCKLQVKWRKDSNINHLISILEKEGNKWKPLFLKFLNRQGHFHKVKFRVDLVQFDG